MKSRAGRKVRWQTSPAPFEAELAAADQRMGEWECREEQRYAETGEGEWTVQEKDLCTLRWVVLRKAFLVLHHKHNFCNGGGFHLFTVDTKKSSFD